MQGLNTIDIQNSEATLLTNAVEGEYQRDLIFDKKPEEVNYLPGSLSHCLIDLEVIQAGDELASHVKMTMMTLPFIYLITYGNSGRNRQCLELDSSEGVCSGIYGPPSWSGMYACH